MKQRMNNKPPKPPKLLMNMGGVYDGTRVTYTEGELRELANYLRWRDPLKSQKVSKERWEDTSSYTAEMPNWGWSKRKAAWVTRYAGQELVVSKQMIGNKWELYWWDNKVGEPGTMEEKREEGTALLMIVRVEQEKGNF